jgi:PIN domain nuclease of toxin-antitoxin system
MFVSGDLISSTEVFDELKDKDLQIWIKKHKDSFVSLSEAIQAKTTEILALYPELVRIRSKRSSSNADPFLIATAIEHDCTVVTNERLGDEGTKDYRIPNICKKYNTPYMSLNDFINEILD